MPSEPMPGNPLLVAARYERGWYSQQELADAFEEEARRIGARVGVSVRQIRRWESRVPPWPKPLMRRVLVSLFGLEPDRLGFSAPTLVVSDEGGAASAVNRRRFVAEVAAVTGARALPEFPAGPAGAQGSPVSRLGTEHVAQLWDNMAALDQLDDAYGGAEVRTLALRHLARVRRLINSAAYSPGVGLELQGVAGALSERCAWMSFDSLRYSEATALWGEALTVAEILEDPLLRVTVLAGMALQANARERPRDALALIRAAQRSAGVVRSPTLTSVLALRESRALWGMHDESGANAAMTRAWKSLERPAFEPEPPWVAFHGPAEIAFGQGLNLQKAGRYKAAVACFRASLQQVDQGFVRNGYLYAVSLAETLAKQGEVEEACAHAEALANDLPEIASTRVRGGLRRIANALAGVDAVQAAQTVDMIRAVASEGREHG